jgi:hypothetical protein
MRFFKYIFASLLILSEATFAAEFPVGSPASERLFELARELYGRGLLDKFEYSNPGAFEPGDSALSISLVKKYEMLADDFGIRDKSPRVSAGLWLLESARFGDKNKNYLKAFPSLKIVFGRKFSANISYRIDSELTNDPRYDGKAWRGVSGMAENATIDFSDGPFAARFGIERLSWGHGAYGNLMFSNQAMPMPVLGFSYRRSIFEFQSVMGFLSPLEDQLDLMENDTSLFTSQQRYLSAHSLTVRPVDGLSVSLREMVIYGGPGRRLEPAYLFPLIWYHGEQLNSRMDDNTMLGLAADYRWRGRLWTYGEILIDDYQAEKETRGGYEPDQLGFLGGMELYDFPIARAGAAVEYTRVTNWTYNQARAHNRYINANFPIGFPDGPDVDRFGWRLWHWPADFVKVSYFGSYSRHGEGRIDTPWSRPWLDSDRYSEPFPTGVIREKVANSLEAMILWRSGFWSNLRLDYTDINNVENIPGTRETIWEFHVNIGLKLPPFSWELRP